MNGGAATWLAYRYLGQVRHFFNLPTFLSVLGMAIGVASLVVSMAVFSGYSKTLEKTVQDAVGHVVIMRRGFVVANEMDVDLADLVSPGRGVIAQSHFVYAEAILADRGRVSGVLLEGVDGATVHRVLNLRNRVIAGAFKLERSAPNAPTPGLIGKGIAVKFGLKVGDRFRMAVPLAGEMRAQDFRPKLGLFEVAGILNFGRHDFDSRYVVVGLRALQNFLEIGDRVTGTRLRLKDPSRSHAFAAQVGAQHGEHYWARDWFEMNRNLFEAAKLEKRVLFFVLMVLVVAAAFNVANTLFISVVRRYRDISVLKTLGAGNALIARIFTVQGMMVGAVGAGLGVAVGLGLCRVFEWAERRWPLIPAEVYKLDHIELVTAPLDLAAIMALAFVFCFLATLVPSRRGARISPVEGLRYE